MSSILARLRRLEERVTSGPVDQAGRVTVMVDDESTAKGSQARGSQQAKTCSSSEAVVDVSYGHSRDDSEGGTVADGWISANRSPTRLATLPKMHNIVVKKVPIFHLVWAPCYYFKGGSPYICARICDHAEARLDPWVVYPIPDHCELVEYLGLPASCVHFDSVPRESLRPIDAVFPGAVRAEKDKRAPDLSAAEIGSIEWSPSYMRNMHHVLRTRCCKSMAETDFVVSYITDIAKEFLRLALEREVCDLIRYDGHPGDHDEVDQPRAISGRFDAASHTIVEVADPSSGDAMVCIRRESRKKMRSPSDNDTAALVLGVLRPGNYIKYYDKIFRDIGLKVSRIVSVSAEGAVALQSGDVLEPTDAVLVMPPSETHECGYNERIGRFANLEEHDFEPGVAKDIETLQQSVRRASMGGFSHLKRPRSTESDSMRDDPPECHPEIVRRKNQTP